MAEWAGVVNDTAPQYMKGAADNVMRERLLLALFKKYGRIEYNQGSYQRTWDVEFSQPNIEAYGDAGHITYERHDRLRQFTLDWRGYIATDLMTEKERLMNKGDVAIVNRYAEIIPALTRQITDRFAAEMYVDGSATGNGNRIHGFESALGAGTVLVGDRVAQPSDTYAGRSTALAAEGGTWSATLSTYPNSTIATDWPDGSGDPEYDYNAPKLVNWSSTAWGTGATTFEDNCERVLRQATIWSTRTGGKSGRPTLYLLASELFYAYQNHQEAKQRIWVPHKEAQDLGFGDVLNQDGVMIQHDFDVPARTGYGLNVHQMSLASLAEQLFSTKGPTEDMKQMAFLFAVGFFGNMSLNVKFMNKLYNYA